MTFEIFPIMQFIAILNSFFGQLAANLTSMAFISNTMIFVLSGLAVYINNYENTALRRWTYIVGICAQPFWFYTSITTHQYGLLLVTAIYTYCYAQGIYTFWIKPNKIGE